MHIELKKICHAPQVKVTIRSLSSVDLSVKENHGHISNVQGQNMGFKVKYAKNLVSRA